MKELFRTNDPVRLSWAEAVLSAAGIGSVVLDSYTSIIEGSIGAIPRRLMVHDDQYEHARGILEAADREA
jgi:Putative prokaryotic signal transducing protein